MELVYRCIIYAQTTERINAYVWQLPQIYLLPLYIKYTRNLRKFIMVYKLCPEINTVFVLECFIVGTLLYFRDTYDDLPISVRVTLPGLGNHVIVPVSEKQPWRICITVTSDVRHDVSNYRSIEFNSLFRPRAKIHQRSPLLSLCERESTGDRWIPHTKSSYAETVSIRWHHNGVYGILPN